MRGPSHNIHNAWFKLPREDPFLELQGQHTHTTPWLYGVYRLYCGVINIPTICGFYKNEHYMKFKKILQLLWKI